MRWIPIQVSIILLPSTPRGVSALMEKTTLAAKEDPETANLWLFPKRLHPAGFVEALPAAFQPTAPAGLIQCRSPTPPSGSAFQHPNTASPASAGPLGALSQTLREPAGSLLPRRPGWHASSLKGHEGAQELTHHSSRSSWWQDRANHWLCKPLGCLQGDPPQLVSQAAQWWGCTAWLQESWEYLSLFKSFFSHLVIYFKVKIFSPYPIKAIPLYKTQNSRWVVRKRGCTFLSRSSPWDREECQPLSAEAIYAFYVKKPLDWNPKFMTGVCLSFFLADWKSRVYS